MKFRGAFVGQELGQEKRFLRGAQSRGYVTPGLVVNIAGGLSAWPPMLGGKLKSEPTVSSRDQDAAYSSSIWISEVPQVQVLNPSSWEAIFGAPASP